METMTDVKKYLHVQCTDLYFKLKQTTKLSKLIDAYCTRKDKNVEAMTFEFNGNLIEGDDTPKMLSLQDDDEILVTEIIIQFDKFEQSVHDDLMMIIKQTKPVIALKNKIRSRYNNRRWIIEGDKKFSHVFHHILVFLNQNEENVTVPNVLLLTARNKSKLMTQSDVIEKWSYQNTNCVRYGCRAKINIPKYTVIGQYIGCEYMEQEFDHSSIITTDSSIFKVKISNKKKSKNIIINADFFNIDEKWNKPLLLYTLYIFDDTLSDKQKENIMFVKVLLNGWPSIFVVAKRLIKQNERLLGWNHSGMRILYDTKRFIRKTNNNKSETIISTKRNLKYVHKKKKRHKSKKIALTEMTSNEYYYRLSMNLWKHCNEYVDALYYLRISWRCNQALNNMMDRKLYVKYKRKLNKKICKKFYGHSLSDNKCNFKCFIHCGNWLNCKRSTYIDRYRSSEQYKKCRGCKAIYYCSKSCQKIDWKNKHRVDCLSIKVM